MKYLAFLLFLTAATSLQAQEAPFTEIQKLLASDAESNDFFGWSVSISGEYAIVGASGESEGGFNAGAAYIYKREESGNWTEVTKLLASDAQSSDDFGYSVSISGEYAIVGAYGQSEGGFNAGAAYIYKREANGNWTEVTKLLASDAQSSDWFGWSVSISGEYTIVGAPRESEEGGNAGAGYIYKREEGGNWTEVTKLIASDAQSGDWFGRSVSISGEYAIVGAYLEGEGGEFAGAAYVYKREANGNWTEVQKLIASDAESEDQFGGSVSISGEYAIVGAYYEDEGGNEAGAAYIFKREESGNWTEETKLIASDAQIVDHFGYSVSISGEYAIVGAYREDEGGSDAGAAYIFNREPNGNWTEITKLVASDAQSVDLFGHSVSISGENAIVGAYYEDEGGSSAGAAYLFEKPGSTVGISGYENTIPEDFILTQNYPNPFNPTTKINFSLPEQSNVKLTIFNTLGQNVAELVNGQMNAGYHTIDFNASDLSSGVYFYTVEATGTNGINFRETKKMILMK